MKKTRWAPIVFLSAVASFVGVGCEGEGNDPPPTPPGSPPINAMLPHHCDYAIRVETETAGDAVVVARLRSVAEYAKTTRGNWVTTWYLLNWDVLSVEHGTWPNKDLKFVLGDTWPTRESGIRIDKLPIPYVVGRVFAFSLKTSQAPPLIVAQEQRSNFPPHRKSVRFDMSTPEGKAEGERVMEAVRAFEVSHAIPQSGRWTIADEAPDVYVVEQWWAFGPNQKAWAFRIEKKTYNVELIP